MNNRVEQLNYLMFENDQNNCWLDAAIVLIAHSTTFKKIVDTYPNSRIKNIISTYNEAQAILNDTTNGQIEQRIVKTRNMLRDIQNNTLHYLKAFFKFKQGEPESAFCALLSLICHDNSSIKENTSISWIWQKNCDNCGSNSKSNLTVKPIITLQKANHFHPESPTSVYICSCKREQEMKLIYKELSNCVIFHFEKGAGKGSDIPLNFTIEAREYHLTCIVVLEKSQDLTLSHFVTWIRNSNKNLWLDCNDLNACIVKFSEANPKFELENVYLCAYEAFDDLGNISHEISFDEDQTENVQPELICLSDEGEDASNAPHVSDHQNIKNEEPLLNRYSKNVEQYSHYLSYIDLHIAHVSSKLEQKKSTLDNKGKHEVEVPSQEMEIKSCEVNAQNVLDKNTAVDKVEGKFVEHAEKTIGNEISDCNDFNLEKQKLFLNTGESLSSAQEALDIKCKSKKQKTEVQNIIYETSGAGNSLNVPNPMPVSSDQKALDVKCKSKRKKQKTEIKT